MPTWDYSWRSQSLQEVSDTDGRIHYGSETEMSGIDTGAAQLWSV